MAEYWEEKLCLEKFTENLGYQNSSHHKRLYEALQNPNIKRLLVIWPPGHAKTTCATINYPAWRVGLERNRRFILTSHTQDFVNSFIRGIKTVMANPQYVQVFGDLKPKNPEIWSRNQLIVERSTLEKDPTFTALSVNTSIIGRRADEIICDDIIDETTANSEAERDNLYRWFTKELLTRLEPDGRILVIGTRWHFADIYAKLLEGDDYDIVKAPLGYRKLLELAINERNEALWPDKWPLERLLARKKEIGAIAFESQYQAHPIASLEAPFKVEWLHYWYEGTEQIPDKDVGKWERLPARERMRVVQAWDLAISENPEADWTVCVTLGVTVEGKMYVLEYYWKHLDFPATIKQVEAQAAAWKPERIAIESVGYQRVLAQALQPGLLPIVQVQQPKAKEVRILGTLSPFFENGTLLINKGMEELILEYLQFPKSSHEDILDALEIAVSQVARRTTINIVGAKRKW